MIRRAPALVLGLVVLSTSAVASAHITLMSPAARYGQEMQKDYPCGAPGNPPGTNPATVLQAGDTITVSWDEFVDHESHYRISISAVGDDAFVNPSGFDDFYNSDTVILDEIMDPPGTELHQVDITVPDTPCDPCTLQLIQVMYGGQFSEGSLYYQCADIVIGSSGAETTGGLDETGGAEGGESSSGAPDPTDATATDASVTDASVTDASVTDASDTAVSEGGTTAPAPDTDASSSGTSPADDDDDSGCSCNADGGGAGAWWLVTLAPMLRRRRR